jgi:hypothetical protein
MFAKLSLREIVPSVALVVVAVLGSTSCGGQGSVGTVTPAMAPSLADSLIMLIEPRSADELTNDLKDCASLKVEAETRMEQAKLRQVRADTEIQVQKSEIESIKAQMELAKKEKNPTLETDLKVKVRLAELEKELLERRKQLRDREIEMWRATADAFETRRRFLESNLQLQQKREVRNSLGDRAVTPELLSDAQKLEREIVELERKTLDWGIQAANKREEVAKQEVGVAKARREIFDAQVKLVHGG